MQIRCPTCRQAVPAGQVNMSTDLALCPRCNKGFRISENIGTDAIDTNIVERPGSGAWFREELDSVVVGASTRSPSAFFLVPFMCVWSGFSLGGIYGSQIVSGKFSLFASLFGIPFILGSILFWAIALMAVFGKVEVRIRGLESTVFTGIGSLGWTQRFDWSAVRSIRESGTSVRYAGSGGGEIVLEGEPPIRLGGGLNEKRRYFMLNALRYLKSRQR